MKELLKTVCQPAVYWNLVFERQGGDSLQSVAELGSCYLMDENSAVVDKILVLQDICRDSNGTKWVEKS